MVCGCGSNQTREDDDDMDKLAREFKGPVKERSCTDVLFLLALLLAYLGMTYIGLSASGQIPSDVIPAGDPQRFLGGIDYKGNICGSDKPVENLSKLYKPNGNSNTTVYGGNELVPEDYSICVKNCPTTTTFGPACDQIMDPYNVNRSWCSVNTNSVLFYCITDGEQSNQNILERMFQDLVTAAEVILAVGIFGALILSYVYIILLKIPYVLRAVVWATIWLVLLALIGGCAYVLAQSKIERSLLKRESGDAKSKIEVQVMEFTAYGLGLAAFVWLCVVLFMRDRIALAIGVIQNSAKAIGRMNFLLMLPLFQTGSFLLFFAIWIYYSLCIVSSGDIVTRPVPGTDDESYKTFEIDENARKLMLFMIMIWLWTSEIITAFGQLVIAYSVSCWYFQRNEDKSTITSFVVVDGMFKTLRYHLGTVATGGLILAIVRPIRSAYAYVYSKLKGKGCGLAKYALCCLNCFFACFEKLLQFLNQSAYIQTAIFGTCFCVSARKGLALMLRNASRVGIVGLMSNLVITVGKCLIMLLCCGFAYWYFTFFYTERLGGYFFPTFVTAVLAYVTANIVCQVMSMSAETILVCYITDEEVFAGIGGFSPPELKKYLSENGGYASDEYDENTELGRKTENVR